jgi:hypothetical protein
MIQKIDNLTLFLRFLSYLGIKVRGVSGEGKSVLFIEQLFLSLFFENNIFIRLFIRTF